MTRNDSSCRGCHRMLRNYLNDNETTLEYNTNDHLSNIDNPLLLNIQSIIDVGIRRKNLRHGFLILIGQRAQALIGRWRTGQRISQNWRVLFKKLITKLVFGWVFTYCIFWGSLNKTLPDVIFYYTTSDAVLNQSILDQI